MHHEKLIVMQNEWNVRNVQLNCSYSIITYVKNNSLLNTLDSNYNKGTIQMWVVDSYQ